MVQDVDPSGQALPHVEVDEMQAIALVNFCRGICDYS